MHNGVQLCPQLDTFFSADRVAGVDPASHPIRQGYDTVRLVDKGIWQDRGYYLEAMVTDKSTGIDLDALRIMLPFGDFRVIETVLMTPGLATQQVKDAFGLMASSIVVAP